MYVIYVYVLRKGVSGAYPTRGRSINGTLTKVRTYQVIVIHREKNPSLPETPILIY